VPGGALVLVDDGRIAGVEPGAVPAPEDCQVLDVPGGTVLPGLVDAHVHLCADGTDGTLDRIGEAGQDAMAAVIEQSLRHHLAAGVTTVRDLGDRRFAVLDWRSSARGGGVYPAVVAAGPPITSVGGHCANMGGEAAGPRPDHPVVKPHPDRPARPAKRSAPDASPEPLGECGQVISAQPGNGQRKGERAPPLPADRYHLDPVIRCARPAQPQARWESPVIGDLVSYQNNRECSATIAGKARTAPVSIPPRA